MSDMTRAADDMKQAAFLISQSVRCLVEAIGMFSTNMQRANNGRAMAYEDDAFVKLVQECGIDFNQAVLALRTET